MGSFPDQLLSFRDSHFEQELAAVDLHQLGPNREFCAKKDRRLVPDMDFLSHAGEISRQQGANQIG